MGNHLMVGGQAVIEGVMMRGPKLTATAVRDPNGQIQVETKDVNSISDRYPILKKPLLRGTVSLIESLVIGIRSLSYSAKMAGEEDEQLTDREMAGTIVFALVLASILFIAIPTGAARLFHFITEDPFFLNLMEGFLRLAIFLGYIWGISRMKDIRRVFQYHGAEHKTIHCYEAGLPLTVENVQKFSRLHPRCGTNFLLIVMLVSIFVFAFLGWPSLGERIAHRAAACRRGHLVRDHPPRGPQREQDHPDGHQAGALAAVPDDAPAGGRYGGRGHRVAQGRAAGGGDRLGYGRLPPCGGDSAEAGRTRPLTHAAGMEYITVER